MEIGVVDRCRMVKQPYDYTARLVTVFAPASIGIMPASPLQDRAWRDIFEILPPVDLALEARNLDE